MELQVADKKLYMQNTTRFS